ncbi:Macrophage migration inhibitory factor (MIF) [Ruminococcus albus]|uniref:Macrophage migration inhibitory factor (MIF) n=2 Tax=Ruminococcus albus TaxID=1264 RepID=A0A1H7P098_RUMAL|nr:Macrophage migration inhibitory factor (MIF) [Ruminococcus albus]
MPIAQMKTNLKMNDVSKTEFLNDVAEEMAKLLKKPLPAVMVMLDDCPMCMNRSEDTVVFSEFRYVLPREFADNKSGFLKQFADTMLLVIQKHTKVDPYRIYMQFTEMDRQSAWRYTE